MKKLLAALLLALLAHRLQGVLPVADLPGVYDAGVKFVISQWNAGKLTPPSQALGRTSA
jgi:hypothetical protein